MLARRRCAVCLIVISLIAPALMGQTFVVENVVRFHQIEGQAQWAVSALERLRGAVWQLGANGAFAFTAPNTATGTLHGKYTTKGRRVEFTASGGYQTGYTASTQSVIQGVIDLSQNPPVLTMVQRTSSVTSAHVNGVPFGANNGSAYQSVVTLRKRRA